MIYRISQCVIPAVLLLLFATVGYAEAEKPAEEVEIRLRAWGVPTSSSGVGNLADLRVLEEFRRQNPLVNPVSSTGISIPGGARTMDMVPLMQIAGDIAAPWTWCP